MTPAGNRLARELRAALAELDEHNKVAPGEVDKIVVALIGHLRSWRPESVSPLGTLPPPGETIRDPRGVKP